MLAYWCYCISPFSLPSFPPPGRGCEGGGCGFPSLEWVLYTFKLFSCSSLVTGEGEMEGK